MASCTHPSANGQGLRNCSREFPSWATEFARSAPAIQSPRKSPSYGDAHIMTADQHIDLEPYDPDDDHAGGHDPSSPAPSSSTPGQAGQSKPVEPLPLE